MTTVPINDTTPKNSYVATAGQTTFPYTYFVNQSGDLDVYVNQVQISESEYTVTNLQEASGGNVIFDGPSYPTGLDEDDVVVIVRCSIIERLSEFEASGAFFASAVNLEYTYGVVIDQDLRRKVQDSLRLSDFETETVKMQIPSVAGNDGNLLRLVQDPDTLEWCWEFASPSDIFTASLPNGTPGTILGYGTDGSVQEYTAGANITIDDATNTISSAGGSSLTIEEEGVSIGTFSTLNFVGAAVTATDAGSGEATVTITATSGGGNLQDFILAEGTDFNSGDTDITLGADPGSEANITWLRFNGVPQDPDCFSLVGTTLTFNNPIPTWVDKITYKLGTTLSINTPAAGTVGLSELANGTADQLLGYDNAGNPVEIDPATVGGSTEVLIVEDQKAYSTNGGGSVANTFVTRDLNTVVRNTISGASLSSNEITLPDGVYEVQWRCPGYQCRAYHTRLFNVSDSVSEKEGSTGWSSEGSGSDPDMTHSFGWHILTVTGGPKTFRLEQVAENTQASIGLGISNSGGTLTGLTLDIYSSIEIRKIG